MYLIKVKFYLNLGDNSPSERVKTIMNKLDKDNNGYLTETEFVEGCINDEVLRSLLAPNA